jgi:hypothetical protein
MSKKINKPKAAKPLKSAPKTPAEPIIFYEINYRLFAQQEKGGAWVLYSTSLGPGESVIERIDARPSKKRESVIVYRNAVGKKNKIDLRAYKRWVNPKLEHTDVYVDAWDVAWIDVANDFLTECGGNYVSRTLNDGRRLTVLRKDLRTHIQINDDPPVPYRLVGETDEDEQTAPPSPVVV